MTRTPKIPPAITNAIGQLDRQYRELESRREDTERAVTALQQQWLAASADHTPVGARALAELANRIASARSALDGVNRDIGRVRQAHAREMQAAEQARLPADALSVRCPGCQAEVAPVRARGSGKGYRSGEYDCPVCDAEFSARWGGGIDPDISIRPH